jgi:hypothetical protein
MNARATFRDDHNPRSMILESYLRYLAGGGSGARLGALVAVQVSLGNGGQPLDGGLSGETGAGGPFTGRRAGRAVPGCRCRVLCGRGR